MSPDDWLAMRILAAIFYPAGIIARAITVHDRRWLYGDGVSDIPRAVAHGIIWPWWAAWWTARKVPPFLYGVSAALIEIAQNGPDSA